MKKNWQKFIFTMFVFLAPVISFAKEGKFPSEPSGTFPSNPAAGKIVNPLGPNAVTSIPVFIRNILMGALKIGIPIVALAIIYSGFLFVFARGNSEKLEEAKRTLLYTLIGAAILLGSLAIATLISNTIIGLATP